jgi:hypothetical protein
MVISYSIVKKNVWTILHNVMLKTVNDFNKKKIE